MNDVSNYYYTTNTSSSGWNNWDQIIVETRERLSNWDIIREPKEVDIRLDVDPIEHEISDEFEEEMEELELEDEFSFQPLTYGKKKRATRKKSAPPKPLPVAKSKCSCKSKHTTCDICVWDAYS